MKAREERILADRKLAARTSSRSSPPAARTPGGYLPYIVKTHVYVRIIDDHVRYRSHRLHDRHCQLEAMIISQETDEGPQILGFRVPLSAGYGRTDHPRFSRPEGARCPSHRIQQRP